MEKKFFICPLNSRILNQCTQVSEKTLQPGSSSAELVPRLYLLPAVSPLALHSSHSSRLPPSSTSAQNPNFFNPASPALTTIPFQLTPPLQTPLTALSFLTQTEYSSCFSYPDSYCSFSHTHILIRSLTPCPCLLSSGLMCLHLQ